MFVPSLSWQNDRFYIKMAFKAAFSYLAHTHNKDSNTHILLLIDQDLLGV